MDRFLDNLAPGTKNKQKISIKLYNANTHKSRMTNKIER